MTQLPTGWAAAPLRQLARNLDSQRVPVNSRERAVRQGDVPYFGAAGQVGWIDTPLFDELLLLLGEDGVQFFEPDRRKAYMISGPSWVNNHAHVLGALAGVNLAYLMHYLNQFDYRGYANGTTRLKLTRAAMDQIPVALAPTAEQGRIVAAIEEAFSLLDAGETALHNTRTRLKRMRDSVLTAAVTGQLVPQLTGSVPVSVSASWSSTKEDPYKELALADLPERWTWARAATICEAVECGGTPPANHMSPGRGDVPFIKVYNLTRHGRLDFSVNPTFIEKRAHAKQSRSAVHPGDVLTNIVGPPLGKVALVPSTYDEWNINQAIVLFRPKPDLSPAFLAFALQTNSVLAPLASTARATAGQFNVSLTACRYLPIPVPPKEEQQRIVTEVERQFSFIEAAERAVDAGLARSKGLRRSVLKAAFEGRLVEQDPADEPASVLLARIAAERAAAAPGKRARGGARGKVMAS